MKNRFRVVFAVGLFIIIVVSVVAIFLITAPEKERRTVARSFITAYYTVTEQDRQYFIPAENIDKVIENLQVYANEKLLSYAVDKYAGFLTENCYEKLLANRILLAPEVLAENNQYTFVVKNIKMLSSKKHEKYDYTFFVSVLQYEPSGEYSETNTEVDLSIVKESGSWKISAFSIYNAP